MTVRTVLLLLLAAAPAACDTRDGHGAAPPPRPGAAAPSPDAAIRGGLPPVEPALDDLYADDLELVRAKLITGASAWRLELRRGERTLRAKWKPLGRGGAEADGGNNAPRCEAAAWRLNRLLFGPASARHVVAPVVVRAFHRDGPVCTRACARVARMGELAQAATFPDVNDHLVLGALTWWIDDVEPEWRMQGGLWRPDRFDADPRYRRRASDLLLFLGLIRHGDANWPQNFLLSPDRTRIYSIDNGRSFDGLPNPAVGSKVRATWGADWDRLARLSPEDLLAPAFSRETAGRLRALDRGGLARELRVVAAVDLATGRSVREPADDPDLQELVARPLVEAAGLTLHERGVWTGTVAGHPWVLFGISEPGIDDVLDRAQRIAARLGSPGGPALFDP